MSQVALDTRVASMPEDEEVLVFRTSYSQQRLWFLEQLAPGNPTYNCPRAVQITGHLNAAFLGKALQSVVDRHESLRTTFVARDGEPVQVVAARLEIPFPVIDLSALRSGRCGFEVERLVRDEATRPFDLERGPLIRVGLLKEGRERYVVLLSTHHLVSDGWSMGVLVRELTLLYEAFRAGRPLNLPELPLQYGDFSEWQRDYLSSEKLVSQLTYWRGKLGDSPRALQLPTDRPRPAVQSFRGARRSFVLPPPGLAELEISLRRSRVTAFMALLASFQVLLNRYSGQAEILVGTPVSGRHRVELEGLVGFLVNTLVIGVEVAREASFRQVLEKVKLAVLDAQEFQDLPFERLVEELESERDLSRSPLFQVAFAMQAPEPSHLVSKGLEFQSLDVETGAAKFDLTLSMTAMDGLLGGSLEYNRDLFDNSTMGRFVRHFGALVEGLGTDLDRRVRDVPFLSLAERHQLGVEWNDTREKIELTSCAHEWFERQARTRPEATAVGSDGVVLSYGALNLRANRLARRLRSVGVVPESVVALYLDRSIAAVVAMLSIWKAGGAYLPLGANQPAERIGYVLDDAEARAVVTDSRWGKTLLPHSALEVRCDEEGVQIAAQDGDNLGIDVAARHLAYVIYTSGSTGRPKGVELSHAGLLNLVFWHQKAYGVVPGDRASQVASLGFDASVWEIWPYLTCGASVWISPEEARWSPEAMISWLATSGIRVSFLPTPLAEGVLGSGPSSDMGSVQALLTGGEKLSWRPEEPLAFRFVNHYGPTEGTVVSTCSEVRAWNPIRVAPPIGRPLPNTWLSVRDRWEEVVAIGLPGELYIGGPGLARGYLGRPGLTAERFVPAGTDGEPGGRSYRTGDSVRYRADGELEFLERIDHQVKVRGFRIELQEIESVLLEHPSVKQAVVVVQEGRSENRLVSYVVPGPVQLRMETLRAHLAASLPDYMVPSVLVRLDAMPLTPNGKVDRRRLPAPENDRGEPGSAYAAPRTWVEELLIEQWQEVLGRERLGTRDSFFELGGHSLLATRLMSRVRKAFGVEIPLRRLFEGPTVAELAAVVESAQHEQRRAVAPPLERVSRRQALPLSFSQERLWFLDRLEPQSAAYNIPIAVRLRGELRIVRLQQAFSEVVRRHEVLRTSFEMQDGVPFQVIGVPGRVPLPIIDLSSLPARTRELTVAVKVEREALRHFDLGRGPVLRILLLRLLERESVLLLTMHHIVSDGWSMGIFLREVAALYGAFLEGRPSSLPELPIQYADYAQWQRGWLQGEALNSEIEYWSEQLRDGPKVLELPSDRPRPSVQSSAGGILSFRWQPSLAADLRSLSRRLGATLFMALVSAFGVLLSRFSGQRDLCIGTPIAGRNRLETEGLIGFFVNTLVLRVNTSGNPRFEELVSRVREQALDAYAHQEVPFEKLVEELEPDRSLAHSPLFQVMFALQNIAQNEIELPELEMSRIDRQSTQANFDLTLTALDTDPHLTGGVEYCTALFDRVTIHRLSENYRTVLEAFVRRPERPVASVLLLPAAARQQLVVEWNDTAVNLAEAPVHRRVEKWAGSMSEAAAVLSTEEVLTYGEINRRANRLARLLQDRGVGPDHIVGVCMERSQELIIAILGILKAGGAYLPLDPAYPRPRQAQMLEDAGAGGVVVGPGGMAPPTDKGWRIYLEAEEASLTRRSAVTPMTASGLDNLAYVIYTSGSTGRPKGVMIQHRSLASYIDSTILAYDLNAGDRILLFSSISFDISVEEIFPGLSCGATLVLHEEVGRSSVRSFLQFCRGSRVSKLFLATAFWQELVFGLQEDPDLLPSSLRLVCIGGEEALAEPVIRWLRTVGSKCRLLNSYGPTETTVIATLFELTDWDVTRQRVPIGRSIRNARARVLDRSLEALPIGVPGELFLGGPGLARGYLREPGLSAERFVPDPFSGKSGGRLYRTGDRARFQPGGDLEFLGRVDHQVKIRGFRVEPGEIEAKLAKHPLVESAIVLARKWGSGRHLVAYVVASEELEKSSLRSELGSELPEYMVPAEYVFLDSLPMTPTGKVDRRSLPEPVARRGESEGLLLAPRNWREELLVEIWQEVLAREPIGIGDNFFELGGHSLLATRLVSRVERSFGVEVPLRTLFEQPTVSGFAVEVERAMRSSRGLERPPLEHRPVRDRAPLSFAQERLWFLDRLKPGSTAYNLPAAVRLRGHLSVKHLERAISEVTRRHEVLRTTLKMDTAGPIQVIGRATSVPLPLVDLRGLADSDPEPAVWKLVTGEADRAFDLERGPLLRMVLLQLAERDHVVLLNMHHIISDGWSMGIFIHEVVMLYSAYLESRPSPLAELSIQYADYAYWQRSWLSGEVLERELEFWRQRLEDAPPVLEIPTDRPRTALGSNVAGNLGLALTEEVSAALRKQARRSAATPFMALLATFGALLGRYSGQRDLCIGTPIAGRSHSETEPLIGFFVNTLVLRLEVAETCSFVELLGRVREVALEAYSHQELPFEKLVAELAPQRSLSHAPIFQVMLSLQNVPLTPMESLLGGLELSPLPTPGVATAKFDLSLAMQEQEGHLQGAVEYNSELFDKTTMRRLVGHLEALLVGALHHPERQVGNLSPLREAERHQLVLEWGVSRSSEPRAADLAELFEAQVSRTPETVSVIAGGKRLSYRALGRRANRLAHHLRSLGVGPEVPVGVCLSRGLDMVVGILAVLKAGGFYVALDPAYPSDRLEFILADVGAQTVLTEREASGRVPAGCAREVRVDGETAETRGASEDVAPRRRCLSQHLAYVLYTSGSTGRPKGVAITHRSAVALIEGSRAMFGSEEVSGILASTSICFDLSVFELFAPLSRGGTVILARDLLELRSLPSASEVTLINTVPSVFAELLTQSDLPSRVRTVNLAGEPLRRALVERIDGGRRARRILNLYGPSEDTTYSTFGEVRLDQEGEPHIGRPLAGTRAYVLDTEGRVVSSGVSGELCLAGEGLSRGYHKRPGLTAERFVPDEIGGVAGGRRYRTGDLVRHGPEGELEFLGRIDHQVKVRGFRIELGEIESVLLEHPSVRETVVVTSGEGVARRIVAYLVSTQENQAPESARAYVASKLPDHMMPSDYVQLKSLPLTPTGKVDRKALPEPVRRGQDPDVVYLAPRTWVEEALVEIWQEVLGREKVGIRDSFFALGGHSLLATRLMSRIHKTLGVELALRRLFEQPTIAALAREVENAFAGSHDREVPPLEHRPRRDRAPLSFAQERLWFLDQLEPLSPAYNIPAAVRIRGPLHTNLLGYALTELTARHEVLRASLHLEAEEPVQVIGGPDSVRLPQIDLGGLSRADREATVRELAMLEATRPFDLRRAPLWRTVLFRLSDREHVVSVTTHHIISDGWSMGIFFRELALLYGSLLEDRSPPLAELPIQYADYSYWQRSWLRGEVLGQELAYWRELLEGVPPLLELPVDRPRPAVQTYGGASRSFVWSRQLTSAVRALGSRHGATLFMTLLAGFDALLSRLSGQQELCVGTPIAGRTRVETEGLIGFFVNTLALPMKVVSSESFLALLVRAREMSLEVYGHQELPFEKLVAELEPERSLSHSPLFQVMFALQNLPEGGVEALPGGLELSPLDQPATTSMFDLSLAMVEREGRLGGAVSYNTDLFGAVTMERFLRRLGQLLQDVVSEPSRNIEDLSLLSVEERHQVVLEWGVSRSSEPRAADLAELFEAQVSRTPEAVSVIAGGERLSYRALGRRANRLARHLCSLGVGPEVPVGVCLSRGLDMVVGILAVLKAGGFYVALDPAYPSDRLEFILADVGAQTVLTDREASGRVPAGSARVVRVDGKVAEIRGASEDVGTRRRSLSQHLAYVLYTSGSTGRPKGVAITHRSAVVLIEGSRAMFGSEEVSGILASTSICFDLSVFELFAPLSRGGTVILARNLLEVSSLPWASEVTLVNTVPSVLAELLTQSDLPSRVRTVNLAGEPLRRALVERIDGGRRARRILNLYGPSEDTTYSTFAEVKLDQEDEPRIGRPIAGTRVYVLATEGRVVSPGVSGELCLAGEGLSRGYHKRPGLTAERFVPDEIGGVAGGRRYRTGDLVRHGPGGELEFLGRLDHQVKVRGFRIELGEIESVLLEHPSVRETVVVVREVPGSDRRLVAYVVADEGTPLVELRAHLASQLPEYMVPGALVSLPSMPLTTTGKIDRRALPEPEWRRSISAEVLVAPRDLLELKLSQIWEDLLGVSPIAPEQNFFELGGHSLLAVRLSGRVERHLDVKLPVSALFQAPTIVQLAQWLRRHRSGQAQIHSSLVTFRASGTRPPFFWIHPVGGNVVCYTQLAHLLGSEQPFYAFQARGLHGEAAPMDRIEPLASSYCQSLLEIDPEGPYYLAGWSMGGLVAYEMARQLVDSGRAVALLVLLDTGLPPAESTRPLPDSAALLPAFARDLGLPLDRFDLSSENVGGLGPDQWLSIVLRRAQQASVLPPDIGLEEARNLFRVFEANVHARLNFRPKPYSGRILILRAADSTQAIAGETSVKHWHELASEGIEVQMVPGDHYSLLRAPNVSHLAVMLNARLAAANRIGV